MQHVANLRGGRTGAAAVEVRGLSHVYAGRDGAVPALEAIDMTVPAGRFVVIVGPSGCGKTSLLMMLAGLRAQSSGTILIDGRPIDKPDPSDNNNKNQKTNHKPKQTAVDNVEFPLALKGAPRAERP